MGNYTSTKAEVKNYIFARTPLIIIYSSERERVERMLKEIASEMLIEVSYYTDSKQVCRLNDESYSLDVDSDPMQHIVSAFRRNHNAIFAFGDVKRISDDNMYSRELLNILYLAKESNCTLILITADYVWQRISQFGMLTTLDYPDIDERKNQINKFVSVFGSKYTVEWDNEDIIRAATLLRGFTEIQIENILSASLVTYKGLFKGHLYQLTKQKSRLYSSISSIQMVNIDQSLEVSGLERLKEWLEEKKKVFFASDEDLCKRDLVAPKGILLAGVPGCGKSFSSKMIAKEWGLPLFRFDIGTIFDKWVGESEKNMKEALQFIDNVAPCVLWIDEIEKALSVSDSGNDTGKRVLGQFLFWLQESNSRVFLVATANDVSLLPAELFRKGRFSEVFFIDLPNDDERKAALVQYSKRSLHINLSDENMRELIRISDGFSYADIEYAIKDIAQLALIHGQAIIDQGLLVKEFNSIVPISKSSPDMVEKIREWGRQRALAASHRIGGVIG